MKRIQCKTNWHYINSSLVPSCGYRGDHNDFPCEFCIIEGGWYDPRSGRRVGRKYRKKYLKLHVLVKGKTSYGSLWKKTETPCYDIDATFDEMLERFQRMLDDALEDPR